MKKLLLAFGFFLVSSITLSLLNSVKAAVICNWNGSASGDWTDVDNWDIISGCPGVPVVNNYNVVFPSTATNKTITNVPDGLVIQSMSLDGNYNITGSTAHIVNGITSTSNFAQINIDLILDANQTFGPAYYSDINLNGFNLDFDSSISGITLNGIVSGNGNITVTNTENHPVNFIHPNTFTGNIDIYANGVTISGNGGFGNPSNPITMHAGAGYLFLAGFIDIPNPITFYEDTGVDSMWGNNTLSGSITAAGNSSSFGVEDDTLTISGALLGSYNITFGNGVNFEGDGALYNGILTIVGSSHINGLIAAEVNLVSNGTLWGTGTLGTLNAISGTIAPGNSPGIININGNMILSASDNVNFEIIGTTPGTGYDQIQVTGSTNLNDATLGLAFGYAPTGGTVFNLINSLGGITGTFAGLPNGSLINIGGQDYIIEYTDTQVSLGTVGGVVTSEISNIIINPTNPTAGQAVTITVVVGTNFLTPTGTVELFDGETSLGTANVVAGNAVFTISNFSVGSHSLTAVYSGDLQHDEATSEPYSLTVNNPILADTGVSIPTASIILIMLISFVGIKFTSKRIN